MIDLATEATSEFQTAFIYSLVKRALVHNRTCRPVPIPNTKIEFYIYTATAHTLRYIILRSNNLESRTAIRAASNVLRHIPRPTPSKIMIDLATEVTSLFQTVYTPVLPRIST